MADIVNPTDLESRRFLNARHLAAVLDVRTSTLKRWRLEGRGPGGWFHASKTLVLYPIGEFETWLAKQRTEGATTAVRESGQGKQLSESVLERRRPDRTGINNGQYQGKRAEHGPRRKS